MVIAPLYRGPMNSPGEGGVILITVGVTAGLLIAVALLVARVTGVRSRPARAGDLGALLVAASPRRRAAVVINPTKVADPARSRARAMRTFERAGWAPPLWLETTADDPGQGQAVQALEAGVDLV